MAVGGALQNIGLYDIISVGLLGVLILSKIPTIRRIYSDKVVQICVQISGAMAYGWIFLTMYGTLVDKGGFTGASLILMRTTDEHSAHFIAFLALMLFGFVTYVHPKPNMIRSMFFVMGVTGFHEFFWNLFYLPTCFDGSCTYTLALSNHGINLFTQGMLTTLMLMLNLAYWYRAEFKAILKMLPYWMGFMVLWELAGFDVTLDARLQAVTSQFYLDPYVNLIEILSWYVFLYPAFMAYIRIHPWRENWIWCKLKAWGTRARDDATRYEYVETHR